MQLNADGNIKVAIGIGIVRSTSLSRSGSSRGGKQSLDLWRISDAKCHKVIAWFLDDFGL